MIGRLEDEKHSVVVKEILALTNRYPSCLTANVINKLSALEDNSSTSSLRTCIQDLRNDFNTKMSKEQRERHGTSTSSGVTIVKVGGNYGSKGELSYKNNAGSRHEISALRNAVASVRNSQLAAAAAAQASASQQPQIQPQMESRKVDSRSTGRLPTHRSMTKLNNFDMTRPPSSGGLHKSMTKLTSSQQNMARSSSQMVVQPTARSVTCITNNQFSRPSQTGNFNSFCCENARATVVIQTKRTRDS